MENQNNLEKFVYLYKSRLINLYESIDMNMLNKIVEAMINCFQNGDSMYVVGNGGSAATASHFQADFRFFVRYFTEFRPKVFALTDNVPLITAISNDNDYEDVFVEQMRGLFKPGDLLLAISASGNSKNVLKAVEFAKKLGGITIGFCGFSGGKLKEITDLPLYTPNVQKDYGPIEDLHMILNHILINYIVTDKEFIEINSQ